MTAALELHDVRKVYEMGGTEVVALDHADLTVDAGRDRRPRRSVGVRQDDTVLDCWRLADTDGWHGNRRW